MNNLAKVFIFKITLTLVFWSLPLILFPSRILNAVGVSGETTYMFVTLLGWAYLALCVGYVFGLKAALNGERLESTIWVGIVSNGGACSYLVYFGATGAWAEWSVLIQSFLWGSALATGAITLGLYLFGVRNNDSAVS